MKKQQLSSLFCVPQRLHACCRDPEGLFVLYKVIAGGWWRWREGGVKYKWMKHDN